MRSFWTICAACACLLATTTWSSAQDTAGSGAGEISLPPMEGFSGGSGDSLLPSIDTNFGMGGLDVPPISGSNPAGGAASQPPATTRPTAANPNTAGNPGAGAGGGAANPLRQNPPASAPTGRAPASRPAANPNPPSRYATPAGAASLDSINLDSSSTGTTSSSSVQVKYAESLIKDALKRPANSQLTGVPVTLQDVIEASNSRETQSESIAAYWDLCSSVSDYYLSLFEQTELERLAQSTQAGAPLAEARRLTETRRESALSAARATQLRLAAMMHRDMNSLPLPGDLPLVGEYSTRYEQTFAGGGSPEAAELNRLLPLRHAELIYAAEGVAEAEDWYVTVASRPANDQGEGIVKSLKLLAYSRRAFVQITRDYNKRITRYTELARPGNLRSERLVAMLIKTELTTASRSAAPQLPADNRRSETSPQPTFREPSQDPSMDLSPTFDSGVVPTGDEQDPANPEQGVVPAGGAQAMPSQLEPGESSVLLRNTTLPDLAN
ncbi:hypothetical protein [Aeoliella mucimassa]|uniref:Outer membrane efflux protein n=1 Tax=Aeoliella mucimassa TaxID=2527972 RepID=A0A518AP37_9BACT|nr:hypothetical protein [Aeoliella mucimassa]QDU56490.1 hypothetical protein Pan181_26990 [Aeoliella mucimassa]